MRFIAVALASAVALSNSLAGAISPTATRNQDEPVPDARKTLMKSERAASHEESLSRVQISPVGSVLEKSYQSPDDDLALGSDAGDPEFDPSQAGFNAADVVLGGIIDGEGNDVTDEGFPNGLPADQGTWNRSATGTYVNGVLVFKPASKSKAIKLSVAEQACLVSKSLEACWELYGSYGTRRLKAEYYDALPAVGLLNPNWMSSLAVQSRRLFNLTLPGSHYSAMYATQGSEGEEDGYGVISQSMTIAQQLNIGIRALDFRVSWDLQGQQALASKGNVARPLVPLLLEISEFLEANPTEIIIVNIALDTAAAGIRSLFMQDRDPAKVPGWAFHGIMNATFGNQLINSQTLNALPDDGSGLSRSDQLQNPLVGSLVEADARIMYFYMGQQVLCYDVTMCAGTPGYTAGDRNKSLIINPLPAGQRAQEQATSKHSANADLAVEPGCMYRSSDMFQDTNPFALFDDVETWLTEGAYLKPPACGLALPTQPPWQTPPYFYVLDAAMNWNATEVQAMSEALWNRSAIFSRGEGFTQRSPAEHFNFLLLAWLMTTGWTSHYQLPNVVFFDYAMPVLIQRLIEPMKGVQDCGWSISCVPGGSCWALSKLGGSGTCTPDTAMARRLSEVQFNAAAAEAGPKAYNGEFEVKWFLYCFAATAMAAVLCCLLLPACMMVCCHKKTKAELVAEEIDDEGDQTPAEEGQSGNKGNTAEV